ncbi:MAG: hypothetical protein GY715_10795, partial [Planctomycetes bacterium]|nr:hypothetical protein [Planctomycetota bacterium]
MPDDPSELPANRLWQPTTIKWFAAIFGGSLLYAVVRYHLAGDVSWAHFPMFILNKATSLAAVIFVASSYLVGKVIHWHDDIKLRRLVVIKFCGLMGFFMAVAHAFLSLALLTPAYFGKYFADDGRLSLQGELAISLGVAALFFLLAPAIATLPMMPKALGGWRWRRGQRMGYLCLMLVAGHLVVLGLNGWLAPGDWPAAIPR